MILKDNLKLLRKASGFNQEEVAAVLGVDRSTYTYYENGKTEPSVKNLVKLAKLFRVSSDELIGCDETTVNLAMCNDEDGGYNAGISNAEERLGKCSADERMMLAYFRMINDKKKVLEVLENEYRLESEKSDNE